MLIKIQKAQSTLEYALLIGVVVGALLAMQNYLKRSVQGRMQVIGDQMGDQYSPGMTHRYENMAMSTNFINETMTSGVNGTTTTNVTGGHQEMNSWRDVGPLENETW
ncbi:MAG: hypothetical protein PHU64_02245 [Candidatus Omnitrophica bacterium]|nr:hypothetical protein [Candidatus Omnitrophota bacterium]MDD5429896.1 hypothetical protein [Candidatus Omnitrophota bacterium]